MSLNLYGGKFFGIFWVKVSLYRIQTSLLSTLGIVAIIKSIAIFSFELPILSDALFVNASSASCVIPPSLVSF